MGLQSALSRLNHLHFNVSNRTNVILINIMTVSLILYSAVGIVYFMQPSLNPWPFFIAYTAWIIIGVCMMLFYRDRPFAAIGLFMVVLSVDRVISWFLGVMPSNNFIENLLEIVVPAWMVVSGIMWITGKVFSRYPAMISAFLMILLNIPIVMELVQYPEIITNNVLNVISLILQYVMYTMLIVILACNDTSRLTKDDVTVSRKKQKS
jgi:hypothetical protein